MDYVVGSIASLISGNVTPNRPKVAKRASTPTKHMPSPNVTPKSEFVDDRSIFLSPSMQKKKAIVKKSPKRIFQNPDLDVTNENEGNLSTTSPKADKVKKHLKNELEANTSLSTSTGAAKTPKKKRSKSSESSSPSKNANNSSLSKDNVSAIELTPKKKKKQRNTVSESNENVKEALESCQSNAAPQKKKKQKNNSVSENIQWEGGEQIDVQKEDIVNGESNASVESPKKKKKKKNKLTSQSEQEISEHPADDKVVENGEINKISHKKKNKKRKKKDKQTEQPTENENVKQDEKKSTPKKIKKIKVNPNAVTDKDSDSEHESDNEIESENEESNRNVLQNSAEVADESSDEEETPKTRKKEKVEKPETEKVREVNTEEEIKRTLFVGNVPFSKKCKKEIKKIFSKYGEIESVRIRTVPVKDPSVTPKVAVIKQELHPERTTVNVYVKFTNPRCIENALAENNTVLNEHHLRVTRSGSTGAEHDPRRSVFVGNVPFALEDEGLREAFRGCGEIESVRIVRDRKTNAGKGFGYVNFASKDSVELALALTEEDLTIKNRIMRVKRCTQATQRQVQKKEQKFQAKNQGKNFPARQGFQGKNKVSQGNRQRNLQGPGGKGFNQGRNFNQGGGNFQNRGGNNFGRQEDGGQKEGAYRRVMNKRKSQDGGEGPAPAPREKKPRKEFVGMTAEKKKKHKFDKGQKKKRALSEILTK